MAPAIQWIWGYILRAAPTCALQDAMCGRPGVVARFIQSGEKFDLAVTGVCWVTVNED